ncbi:MAG TPA: hypothetical protein VGS80_25570, partial [Ktedonobacterales bacterium]|nr:hypothetical protein [Ktedonobacterales bacterium]
VYGRSLPARAQGWRSSSAIDRTDSRGRRGRLFRSVVSADGGSQDRHLLHPTSHFTFLPIYKGGAIPIWCAQRLTRLRTILGLRAPFAQDLAGLRTGQAWLFEADALLTLAGAQQTEQQQTFAMWRDSVARSARQLPPPYADCLAHFVGVLTRLQPHLFAWTTQPGLSQTNNDLERFIRAMKTRYRRMSGRKNWQTYLLRYGQRIAFYEASCLVGDAAAFDCHLRRVAYAQWPHARLVHRPLAHRLCMQFRFAHRRAAILRSLEESWPHAPDGT